MYQVMKFNLGRDCLRHIIRTFNIKELHIPYYLCDVIRHTLFEEGCKPIFYHIDDNFYPAKEFSKDDYILYPNYFGICSNNVQILAGKYPKLIVDNAHAYYDKPQSFACFNAGHKFGFKESLLWIKDINGRDYDTRTLEDSTNERKAIFNKYHNLYGKTNLLKIPKKYSIPFVYPYLADTEENADKLVSSLNKKGKTVYRYWGPLPKSFNEYKFFLRLVPIPILPELS